MPTFKSPADMVEGDRIDLMERDQTPANRAIWEFEFAEVESVSVLGKLSGGWCDGLVTKTTSVIYTSNGASPSVVVAGRKYPVAPEDGDSCPCGGQFIPQWSGVKCDRCGRTECF